MEISLLFDFYRPLLSSSQQQAFSLYYNEDLSLAEIAAQIDISRQGVRDLVKRSESQLYKFEDELGLFNRFKLLNQGLESVKNKAEKIIEKSSDNSIIKTAVEICSIAENLQE